MTEAELLKELEAERAARKRAEEEAERLERERLELSLHLHGWKSFIGPCEHGRDPWTRCSVCGEGNAVQAVMRLKAPEERAREESEEAERKRIVDNGHLYGDRSFRWPCVHGRAPWNRCQKCNKGNAVQAAVARLLRAEADNKALYDALRSARDPHSSNDCTTRECWCGLTRLLDSKHPGADLLERWKQAAVAAVVAAYVEQTGVDDERSPVRRGLINAILEMEP